MSMRIGVVSLTGTLASKFYELYGRNNELAKSDVGDASNESIEEEGLQAVINVPDGVNLVGSIMTFITGIVRGDNTPGEGDIECDIDLSKLRDFQLSCLCCAFALAAFFDAAKEDSGSDNPKGTTDDLLERAAFLADAFKAGPSALAEALDKHPKIARENIMSMLEDACDEDEDNPFLRDLEGYEG